MEKFRAELTRLGVGFSDYFGSADETFVNFDEMTNAVAQLSRENGLVYSALGWGLKFVPAKSL